MEIACNKYPNDNIVQCYFCEENIQPEKVFKVNIYYDNTDYDKHWGCFSCLFNRGKMETFPKPCTKCPNNPFVHFCY